VAAHTKNQYLGVQTDQVGAATASQMWQDYWDWVTTKPIARDTYERALRKHPLAFALVPGWLYRMVFAVPLAVIMLAVVTLVSPFLIKNWSSLSFVLSIAVFFGLVGAVVGVAVGCDRPGKTLAHQLPDFAARVDELTCLSDQERRDLTEQGEGFVGKSARIINIRTGPRCRGALTSFLGWLFLVVMLWNLLALLLLILVSLVCSLPLTADRSGIASAYGRQAGLLTLAVTAALVAFRLIREWNLATQAKAPGGAERSRVCS